MGDKSPKSKERDQKQKAAASKHGAAAAKAKQEGNSRGPKVAAPVAPKGKKK